MRLVRIPHMNQPLFHLNPETGNTSRCQAKTSEACPFHGYLISHSEDEREVARSYEKLQEGHWLAALGFAAEVTESDTPPTAVWGLLSKFRSLYLESTQRDFQPSEERLLLYSREVVRGMAPELHPSSPQFWQKWYLGMAQQADLDFGKPKRLDLAHVQGSVYRIGTDANAQELLFMAEAEWRNSQGIEDYKNRLIARLAQNVELKFIGSGVESLVFLDQNQGVVWKFPVAHEPDSADYVKNTLIAVKDFPEMPGMRHAATTGYFESGLGGVLAQEYLPLKAERRPNQSEFPRLIFAGHDDFNTDNFATDDEGMLVAIDTCGHVWDDLDLAQLRFD